MIPGLTPLGSVHTVISLVAVALGLVALLRHGGIDATSRSGRWYAGMTIATCLTGFGIFEHGGFGKPHALGVVTLLALALAAWAGRRRSGLVPACIETVTYSLTLFFHMIPAVAESATRLPLSAPWLDDPEAPQIQAITGVLFLVFLVGATLQVQRLRAARRLVLV